MKKKIKNEIELNIAKMLIDMHKQEIDAAYDAIDFYRRQIDELQDNIREAKNAIEEYEMENGEGDKLAQQAMEMEIQRSL